MFARSDHFFLSPYGGVKKQSFFTPPKGIGKNGQNWQISAREAYWCTSRADFVCSKKENFTEKLNFLSFSYLSPYNDNRKSKFLNFDGKSLICQQFS